MEQKKIDFNALGQVIDTTWGRSSTSTPVNGSVKVRMHAGMLYVTFGVQTNTNARHGMPHVKQVCNPQALSVINNEVERIKRDYKEYTGSSIKLKQVDCTDSIECISTSANTVHKTVLYRMSVILEVS